MPANPLQPLPYTVVDIDEAPAGPLERVRRADASQWKLWAAQYAWLVSLLTAAPGIAYLVWRLTGDLLLAVGVVALATLTPGVVYWRRTRSLT